MMAQGSTAVCDTRAGHPFPCPADTTTERHHQPGVTSPSRRNRWWVRTERGQQRSAQRRGRRHHPTAAESVRLSHHAAHLIAGAGAHPTQHQRSSLCHELAFTKLRAHSQRAHIRSLSSSLPCACRTQQQPSLAQHASARGLGPRERPDEGAALHPGHSSAAAIQHCLLRPHLRHASCPPAPCRLSRPPAAYVFARLRCSARPQARPLRARRRRQRPSSV